MKIQFSCGAQNNGFLEFSIIVWMINEQYWARFEVKLDIKTPSEIKEKSEDGIINAL